MIDIQSKIHDKFSVEFKIGYHAQNPAGDNNFAVNTWIFVPNSLDINPQTYSNETFYRDIKSNIRLITPDFLLREISNGQAIPLYNLEKAFRDMASSPERKTFAEYEYHIKMFSAIVKSSVRDESLHIMDSPINDIEIMCNDYVENIRHITSSYRNLRHIINVASVPDGIINYFLFGDEFISGTIEKYTFRLICNIENVHGNEKYKSATDNLRELINDEIAYSEERGYPIPEKNSADSNRDVVFRHGILKKYIESDLFLEAKKKRDAVMVEQIYMGIAAGVSMIFATAIAFASQLRYGNFTMPLFVALVVSYMLKDRIKELMRYYFAHQLKGKYFDNKTSVGIKEQKIGWVKEGMDFITEDKAPPEVMEIRSRSILMRAENRMNDEKIILYRKMVNIDGALLRSENQYSISGINEIVRLHLNSFVQKMDNPQVPLYIFDDQGEILTIEGDKVYYINIIMQLQYEGKQEYKRYRLNILRNGIRKIEELK